jgi:7,8-dihydroneopterin aldolase/epimerase/oxygenase
MKNVKTTIAIGGIECYAYHGCLDEEGKIGNRYLVDVQIDKNVEQAVFNDELNDTVDYVVVNKIVKEQMAIRSKLIEHVAGRILKELSRLIPGEKAIEVRVTKFNPPVNGNMHHASFTIKEG